MVSRWSAFSDFWDKEWTAIFCFCFIIFDLLYKNGWCNCMTEVNYYFECCVMSTHTCLCV